VAGNDAGCTGSASPFHCQYACECAAGDSCCGAIEKAFPYTGSASCQAVPSGGSCTGPAAEATAQLCKQSAECKNGQPCIAQTCTAFAAKFQFCGLQSGPPFDCTADPTDAGGQ
jgi:hypothetical protein